MAHRCRRVGGVHTVRVNSLLRTWADWSPIVFTHESPTHSARFDAENGLYLFALQCPSISHRQAAPARTKDKVRGRIVSAPCREQVEYIAWSELYQRDQSLRRPCLSLRSILASIRREIENDAIASATSRGGPEGTLPDHFGEPGHIADERKRLADASASCAPAIGCRRFRSETCHGKSVRRFVGFTRVGGASFRRARRKVHGDRRHDRAFRSRSDGGSRLSYPKRMRQLKELLT
jgi:hypothetical protein